jgi:hypothetical protein
MTVRSSDLTPQEWQALQRVQNRLPATGDTALVERLKAMGLVEDRDGRAVLTKPGNRLLAQGRQHG